MTMTFYHDSALHGGGTEGVEITYWRYGNDANGSQLGSWTYGWVYPRWGKKSEWTGGSNTGLSARRLVFVTHVKQQVNMELFQIT